MRKYSKILIFTLVNLALLTFWGCRSAGPCPKQIALGNVGSVVNTEADDYLPLVFEQQLWFTSVREIDKIKTERLFKSEITEDGLFLYPQPDTLLPLKNLKESGSPSFYRNQRTGELEIFFAAQAKSNKVHIDIYHSKFSNGKWSVPTPLPSPVNTDAYESHPFISANGDFLIFTSDRQGSIGETDLYITRRDANNEWSVPENLGPNINTERREISPFVSKDGSLYYSSQGFATRAGFDIIKASPDGKGLWNNAKRLDFPINTEFNETGPTIYQDKIVLSSDRFGGCGGFDIYAFDICMPAILTGKVVTLTDIAPDFVNILLYDANNKQLEDLILQVNDSYEFHITPNQDYKLVFVNPCFKNNTQDFIIKVPCSDSSVIKLIADFILEAKDDELFFEQYEVPFFVSGYYYPNTLENLQALRMKFDYNLFGNADSTRYIEKPGAEYDNYTEAVEKALNEAIDVLIKKLDFLDNDCIKSEMKLNVTIYGYADPRPISELAKYADNPISDRRHNLDIRRGAKMTNQLLSTLRAYFTAQLFEQKLEQNAKYQKYKNRIIWNIDGKGIDTNNEILDKEKRRVSVSITLVEQ